MINRGTRTGTVRIAALLASCSLLTAGCGVFGGSSGDLAVGSKEFNEQHLLGQIAIIALEDAGLEVDDETGIQGTENVRKALTAGDIGLYWEYTGTGWVNHLGHAPEDAPTDPTELFEQVKTEDADNDIVWMAPADANNTYAIAAHSSVVQELGVTTLSDYAALANEDPEAASLCAASEFLIRQDGWLGVEQTYGFQLPLDNVAEMELNVIYTQLPDGDRCNFGEVFATDGRIVGNDLVVIEDDKQAFVSYNVALTVRADVLEEFPEIEEIFAAISALLDTQTLTELNARIDVDQEEPADVARDFLESNGLLTGGGD